MFKSDKIRAPDKHTPFQIILTLNNYHEIGIVCL